VKLSLDVRFRYFDPGEVGIEEDNLPLTMQQDESPLLLDRGMF
jgi:hypothetical protein